MTRPRRVKLRHLLAHNSGLPGYVEFFRRATTPAALLRACLQLPLEAEPGTRAEYSDPGFILLGKALEVRAATNSWINGLQREIFHPLGMAATGFCPAPDGASRRFRQRKKTPLFAIAASKAKCRMKMRGC